MQILCGSRSFFPESHNPFVVHLFPSISKTSLPDSHSSKQSVPAEFLMAHIL